MAFKVVAFDLDDTLAESKQPIEPLIAEYLVELARLIPVCIISGGRYEQFQTQLIAQLPADSSALVNLHLMPTCGTAYYRFIDDEWQQIYAHNLADTEITQATTAIEQAAQHLGFWEPHSFGPRIDNRGTQVTFSALGQQAPPHLKKQWDPTGTKREQLRQHIQQALPGLEVRAGGSTSIDITRHGIDKAFGIRELIVRLDVDPSAVLFVGDRLEPGGNDHAVIATGVQTQAVKDHTETAHLLPDIIDAVQ